jgi:hypothetical protein
MKLRGLVPNSYIHVSLSDLHIPMIGQPILLQRERGRTVSFLGVHKSDHHLQCRHKLVYTYMFNTFTPEIVCPT